MLKKKIPMEFFFAGFLLFLFLPLLFLGCVFDLSGVAFVSNTMQRKF